MKPKGLHHIYRNHLSDYHSDSLSGKWKGENIPLEVDTETGEVGKEKPLYICKPENMGSEMCIDDKHIGKGSYTILSNQKSGKIALLIESVKFEELILAMEHLGDKLKEVVRISSDMSPTYLKLCRETFPNAQIVIDKFHVIQYAYDALQQVRLSIKKSLNEQLSDSKEKTQEDLNILAQLELLKRTRYLLNQSQDDWTAEQKQMMETLFKNHELLHRSYQLVQLFKQWYDVTNVGGVFMRIEQGLHQWLEDVEVSGIKAFEAVCKMITKHEKNIMNFFINANTNAKAERLNGKIKRFIANNYGMRDKDFALYRIKGYFS